MSENTISKTIKKSIKRQWEGLARTSDFSDADSIYEAIRVSSNCIMLNMVDFLWIDAIHTAFFELAEVVSNINIMLSTHSFETKRLCKERVDYLLKNRSANWYI